MALRTALEKRSSDSSVSLERGSSADKGYRRPSVERRVSGSLVPPSEEPVSGEADLRGGRGPKKWTTFVFRQSEVFLEYFSRDSRGGLRFAGSLSLARLLWFPAAGPEAVTLELHLEGETVELRPLDDAARWERAIRAWACHFRGVSAAELLAGTGMAQSSKTSTLGRKSVTRLFRRTLVDEETVGTEGGVTSVTSPPPLPTLPALQAVFKKKSKKEKKEKSGMTMIKTMTIGRRKKKTKETLEEEEEVEEGNGESFRVGKKSQEWVEGFKLTRGKWETCAYRLAGGRLMCFKSVDDAAPVSFVELASVGEVSALGMDHKKYAVEVECGGQKRLMGFESSETAESWTERVKEARDKAKKRVERGTVTERRRNETNITMSLPVAGNVMADDSAAMVCFEELQMFDGEEEAGGSAVRDPSSIGGSSNSNSSNSGGSSEVSGKADPELAGILEDLMEWETLDMTGMRNRFDTLQVVDREDLRRTILQTVSKHALKRDAADRARLALRLRMGLAKVIGREREQEEEEEDEEEEEGEREEEEEERETVEFEEVIFDSEDAPPSSPPPVDYEDTDDTTPPPLEDAPVPPPLLIRESLRRQQLLNK